MNNDPKNLWKLCGLLDGIEKESEDFVVRELEELKRFLTEEVEKNKDLVSDPDIFFILFFILVKMIKNNIPYGNIKLHLDSVLEYSRKNKDDKTVDYFDYNFMRNRTNDYLDWLKDRRSIIL